MEWHCRRPDRQFDALCDDNQQLGVELAVLNERILGLPSRQFIVKIVMSSMAFLTAVIVFADKIKAMFL